MVKNVNFLSGGSSNTYCSLYRAVFTSSTDHCKTILICFQTPYCSLYRAVFTYYICYQKVVLLATYCSLYRAVFTSVLLQNHPFLFQLIAHYIELYSRELTEDESHELESNLIAHYIELYSQFLVFSVISE